MNDGHIHLPVAEAYDRWAPFYDSYDNPMVFGASQLVGFLSKAIEAKVVVEFGCGTGRNLARLKQDGAERLIGCDVSPGMLEKARARDPAFILFQQDMTQPLPLADGVADLALFSLSLEHVAELVSPLREARRLIKATGAIAVIEIHPFLSLGDVSAHFRDGDAIVRMPTFPHRFSDYINAAAQAGLAIAACREWRPRDFQGAPPEKLFKRGPDIPLLVAFTLTRGEDGQSPDAPRRPREIQSR
ncbi:SAM-dependent methyltransferase [Rhodoblastus sphagnicola]|uniref:SAM-dependent methyltransferase n=1 Tax=Rhodoblastus sphagnicola TaxID=333368 RepID=A0A2S6NG09_9HYPH|nr:class I SAM-dependent methyltransferase [Rhodoblastus sphagnicola]MBB4199489.1 malonyl-CoA O-methyltransferase [Rhodoblastus sphagnicola]PPQ33546.1 SAM-dependent methyltransferase [Rhodoblastus sphagnicola]